MAGQPLLFYGMCTMYRIFGERGCQVLAGDKVIALATKWKSLYILEASITSSSHSAYISNAPEALDSSIPLSALITRTTMSRATLEVWHHRLGHANIKNVLKLEEKDMVTGMELTGPKDHDTSICEACTDVCGPMETTARTGHWYFVTYIDGHSHHQRVLCPCRS